MAKKVSKPENTKPSILKKYSVVVQIEIAQYVNAEDVKEAIGEAENLELPEGYIEDTYKIVEVSESYA